MRVFNRKFPTFDLLIAKRKSYPNRILLLNICEYTLKMCSKNHNCSILCGIEPNGCGHWSLPFHPTCVTLTHRPLRSSCCWSCYCPRLRLRPPNRFFRIKVFFIGFCVKFFIARSRLNSYSCLIFTRFSSFVVLSYIAYSTKCLANLTNFPYEDTKELGLGN